jgi:hypothetical protein
MATTLFYFILSGVFCGILVAAGKPSASFRAIIVYKS